IDRDLSQEQFFVDGHPASEEAFHGLDHSLDIGRRAAQSAKARGRTENEQVFLKLFGQLHDFHPNRQPMSQPKMEETLKICEMDFNRVRSLKGEDGKSVLRDELGFGKLEFAMFRAFLIRSDPNVRSKYAQMYEDALGKIQELDPSGHWLKFT